MQALPVEDRLNLVKFVCSFVWADLHVSDEERDYVRRLVRRLELPAEERAQVEQYLRQPPAPEEVDPNLIPMAHRELFLDTIRGVIASDLELSTEEREGVRVLESLLND